MKDHTPIPTIFPSTPTDRLVSAVFSSVGDIMIQVEMTFPGVLDTRRLERALQLVLDAEPVLGCRFVYHPRKPYWERLPRERRPNFESTRDEKAYASFRSSTIRPGNEPAVKGMLLEESPGCRLLLKIAHEAADAGGSKDVAYLVASLYRALGRDPEYRPDPNLTGRRGIRQALQAVPWHGFPRIFLNYLAETRAVYIPVRSHNPPLESGPTTGRNYVVKTLAPERVRRIAEWAQRTHATINDMIMTAFLRALMQAGWDGESQLRSAMTVDLRRWYLENGRAEAVCNLSGIEVLCLGTDPGVSFADTLLKVASFTRKRKKDWFGLNLYAGLVPFSLCLGYGRFRSMVGRALDHGVKAGILFPIFTNLGPIEEDRLVFDERPRKACVIVPTGDPPFFAAGLSGYRGSLTLTAGTYPQTHDTVNALFEIMLQELPS